MSDKSEQVTEAEMSIVLKQIIDEGRHTIKKLLLERDRLKESNRKLVDDLSSILPMAKGYAYAHQVGRNMDKIISAVETLAKAEGKENEEKV